MLYMQFMATITRRAELRHHSRSVSQSHLYTLQRNRGCVKQMGFFHTLSPSPGALAAVRWLPRSLGAKRHQHSLYMMPAQRGGGGGLTVDGECMFVCHCMQFANCVSSESVRAIIHTFDDKPTAVCAIATMIAAIVAIFEMTLSSL